jgi:hypothetical protein
MLVVCGNEFRLPSNCAIAGYKIDIRFRTKNLPNKAIFFIISFVNPEMKWLLSTFIAQFFVSPRGLLNTSRPVYVSEAKWVE